MKAGDYRTRYEWMRHTYGTPTGKGEKPDVYTSAGHLWGTADEPTASPATVLGSEQQETRRALRLRNLPDVRPLDVLVDAGHAEAWRVESSTRGDNERACEVTRCAGTAPYSPIVG